MQLRLSDLVFRHQSPRYYDVLRPVTYAELGAFGRDDGYVEERRRIEGRYRRVLGMTADADESFLYATVVGFHLMESPRTYPGFTYYFRLSADQLSRSACHIVDPNFGTSPLPGVVGLQSALTSWMQWSRFMSPVVTDEYREDPRIEVVIGCPVAYDRFVTQAEDRLEDQFGGIRMNTNGHWH